MEAGAVAPDPGLICHVLWSQLPRSSDTFTRGGAASRKHKAWYFAG